MFPGMGRSILRFRFRLKRWLRHTGLAITPKPDDDGTVRWWCTDPRTILYPDEFKASRSLKKSARNRGYKVTVNKAFEDVISHCASRLPPKIRRCWASYESVQAGEFDWLKDLDQAGVCKTRYKAGILTVTFNSRWESLKYLGPPSTWDYRRNHLDIFGTSSGGLCAFCRDLVG